jgi:serine/alanine adding enzyme
MAISVTTAPPPIAWDEFTQRSLNSNIFHTRSFVDIFLNSGKYTPYTYFLMEEERIVAALIAIQITLVGGPFSSLASRAVSYGGLLTADGAGDGYWQRHLPILLDAYDEAIKKKVLLTQIRNMSDAACVILPLARRRYTFDTHLNYLIDLTVGEKRLWENLSQGLRRALRKAEKGEIEIVEVSDEDLLAPFHDLVSATHAKVHIPVFELDIFKKAWHVLFPLKQIRITLAKYQGRFIGARAALFYKGRVFDWFAGSSGEGDAMNANALLAWDMIAWGSRSGGTLFDFGGAGDPNKPYGVREFKMRFSGQLVNFGRFTRIYSLPRYALSSAGLKLLKPFLF